MSMMPLNEQEAIDTIEGTRIEAYEGDEPSLDEVERIILEASNSRFWKEVFIPELNNTLATLDGLMTTETEPWRRYAYVEAYKVMCTFKLKFLTALDRVPRHED